MLTSPRAGCALQIADFGLAREGGTTLGVTLGARATPGGGGAGTVCYMAPELLVAPAPGARPQRPTYRSDVFAATLVAWQILAASAAPYPGFNDEQARAHVQRGGRPDLAALPTEGVPLVLPALLASGWAAAPNDRPCRGGEFLEALQEAAPPTGPPPLPPALALQGVAPAAAGAAAGAAGAHAAGGSGNESLARAPEVADWRPGFVVPECPVCAACDSPGVRLGCAAGHALCLECLLRTVRSELTPGATMVRCPVCRATAPPVHAPVAEAAVAEVAAWSASPARTGGLAAAAAAGPLRPLAADELVARFARIEADRARQSEAAQRAEAEAALPEHAFKRCPGRRADGAPCGEGIQHPRGHACRHIKPGSGCPTCGTHFCYSCMGPYNRGCPNRCPTFCTDACDCPDCLERKHR